MHNVGSPNMEVNMGIGEALEQFAKGTNEGLRSMASHTAKAAAQANAVSAGAQQAQGAFNQASANNANAIGADRIGTQYQFNSGQAASANDFTKQMWGQAAAWNEDMFNRQMEFNAEQAQINRDWQERMMSTAYQRATKDMQKAGLNPILAVTGGGISTGSGGGSAATVSSPQMSGASGAMASGGLMNGISASEGNYTGQMEYMAGILGIISAMMDGISSAAGAFGSLGQWLGDRQDYGYQFSDFIQDIFNGNEPFQGELLEKSKTPYGQRGRNPNDHTSGYGSKNSKTEDIKERWRTHN